jgi:hypothetical protein
MFGIGEAVAAGLKILDKFIPDPADKAEAEEALRDALMAWDKTQTEINKAEALHRSVFVAGWRPFIGWTCGAAFLYHFLLVPLILLFAGMNDVSVQMPEFDMQMLMTVLMGMLGLGGLRTYEKIKGVSK